MPSPRNQPRRQARIVAEVCLYAELIERADHHDHHYAFLATGPDFQGGVLAEGGWAEDGEEIAGDFDNPTDCIDAAKGALRALGIRKGTILVTLPWGTESVLTSIDRYQSLASMKRSPSVPITAGLIRRVAWEVAQAATGGDGPKARSRQSSRQRARLGTTSSGKAVLELPAELGVLEKLASEAAAAHGLFSASAKPVIVASQAAQRAHVSAYAASFTPEDHREAAVLIGRYRDTHAMGRHLYDAHNGVQELHERAAQALEQAS
ncbi:MAG: hypothetical protein IT378_08320 [Sandaracinaceae bacterium]|nr:hypothetical protein [Sandaracinaceae bacterium]